MSDTHTVDVERLIPHPHNARRGDVPAIMRSLEKFGQVKPIIAQRSTRYVVAGNHVLEAAKRLGWKTIQVQIVDMDDETATGYLIADNRTSDRGTYDRGALLGLLSSALELDGTGYSEEEVEELAEQMGEEAPEWQRDSGEAEDDVVRESKEQYDPMREILLMVPLSKMEAFTVQIKDMQEYWGEKTTVDAIRRCMDVVHAAIIREQPEPPPELKQGVDF
jgi:ParB family chromosome partitioning protein